NGSVSRSLVTIDLAAVRHNARTLAGTVAPAELWAVVKADGYGHGDRDVRGGTRILVLGPTATDEVAAARDAGLELTVADDRVPDGVPVHLKLDTGMARWGLAELPRPGGAVVGLMTHFATADTDR